MVKDFVQKINNFNLLTLVPGIDMFRVLNERD